MSRGTKAWMLRQDGVDFPVIVHFYASGDDDLSSEAECAAFLVKSGSKDIDLAYQVLDAWMAILIENKIDYDADEIKLINTLTRELNGLPYHFQYNISVGDLINIHNALGNYTDIDSLYDYIDGLDIKKMQEDIRRSINQQFCRVRYGGRLDEEKGGQGALWCRISSIGYNWANTLYVWVANHYRGLKVDRISICRDYESDYGDADGMPDYFYKAKDGTPYYELPIEDYLAEEHEHSPVFSTSSFHFSHLGEGVIANFRSELSKGNTVYAITKLMEASGIYQDDSFRNILNAIHISNRNAQCIQSSDFMDNANIRTRGKLLRVKQLIQNRFPEITISDIDVNVRENTKGNMVGCEVIYTLESNSVEALDHIKVSNRFTKDLSQVPVDGLVRLFTKEYLDYCRFANIQRVTE